MYECDERIEILGTWIRGTKLSISHFKGQSMMIGGLEHENEDVVSALERLLEHLIMEYEKAVMT